MNYPLNLACAYLLLAGYAARTAFEALRLPGAVGILLVGYSFQFFMQDTILAIRNELQSLAFFLVLLHAGFEVRARNLSVHAVVMAVLPSVVELLGIALCAVLTMGFDPIEALVFGTVLCPMGEGLVIPKMMQFRSKFPDHPLPPMVLTWAPLEASLVLTLFGVFSGLAGRNEVGALLLLLDALTTVLATLVAGSVMGWAAAKSLSNITKPTFRGRQLFTGTPVEAFLLTLGVALLASGLGDIVPAGFIKNSKLFDSELFVIVTGSFFAHCTAPDVLHGVEGRVAGTWVFGGIVLFTMLGSRADLGLLSHLPGLLPVMAVGLVSRFLGICAASLIARGCWGRRSGDSYWLDVLFCFLCALPRATIQGALGSKGVTQKLFHTSPNHRLVRQAISDASKVYIVCYSIVGSLLLEFFGPKLLEASAARKLGVECGKTVDSQVYKNGGNADCKAAEEPTVDVELGHGVSDNAGSEEVSASESASSWDSELGSKEEASGDKSSIGEFGDRHFGTADLKDFHAAPVSKGGSTATGSTAASSMSDSLSDA